MKIVSHKARRSLLALFSAFAVNSFSQTTIYSENFTSNNWTETSTGSGNGDWIRGTDASHSTGATGKYYYSKKFGSDYKDNTFITATSPAINLTGYNSITLELKVWYKTESEWDGMKIEYSLNNGSSWNSLGSVSSNWYNDTDVDAFSNNEDGWSGDSNGWQIKSISLTSEDIGFNSATQAKFRVLFASDDSVTDTGVAFDEFIIKGYNGYCPSTGNTEYRTGTRRVTFNTIDKTSPSEFNDYSDYTSSESTSVYRSSSYDLTVKVNTDGNYTTRTYVWIDWNQDMDFDDPGESYNLGSANNVSNGNTSLSPLSITIPASATLGTTRMRVSTKYNSNPSACEIGFDGEVEDYGINVIPVPVLSTGTISPTTYCSGASVSVPYTFTGTFISGNVFTAQLSNASGSFASPVSIGTLTSTNSGTISATIPIATSTGSGYRIRIVSNNPAVIGTDNGNNITITAIPSITGTTPNSRCGTGTVTLSASASAGTINWYANATGGSSLGTGTSFTTPSISSTTTYWVAATNGSCTTATRTSVTATVNSIPTITGTTPNSRCGTGTVTLSATASAGTINWYANATGGSSLGTGTSFTTPSISSTTTYWVAATNGSCTTTTRTSVTATVNSIPTITGTTPNSRCGTGTVTLNATASAGTINWYANATGGSSLGIGTSFTTPSISSTTTYWVAATNGSCTTATRTSVTATVNTSPTITGTTPNSRCGTGTVTLNATASAGTINWYANATGGSSLGTGTSFTTPSISSTTTYWVDATNGSCTTATRTSVTATVNTIPTITGTTPNSRCGTGTVTLGATTSTGTINWYANATGGSSLGTGTSFTTPSISSTTTYWVDATNGGCTTATRTAIIATVTKNYWTGDIDSNWNNPSNWCAGVPTNGIEATLNTLIPSGLTNYPIISNGTTSGYVKTIVLESNTTLTVIDNSIRITENLKLDGKIDLEEESQLLQDLGSTLDVTSSGILEMDQQGTADTYTYNYWSSPVGKSNSTTNNNSYKVTDIFKNVTFLTSGYNGTASPLGIADYWIWKFNNQLSGNYASWQHVRSTGTLIAGEGFSMKGPGTGSIATWQNYVLAGKPNNGNINLAINAGNDYLVGNPYPSALDADQFILDNGTTIAGPGSTTGTLYFWEHWGGGSHYLRNYQGGYATYTLAGGVPAAAMGTSDPNVATGGTPTKTPGRYIPVAQGFFVTAEATGTIKFNNGQRVFQVEDGTNSVFMKSTNTKTEKSTNAENKDVREKLRLTFLSVNTIRRQLLTTVDANTSMGYDWGYDAPYIDEQMDDMYWLIGNNKYTIQGINTITEQTILPLGIHTKTKGLNTISIYKTENTASDLKIYLHDKKLNLYHNLKDSNYQVYLEAGSYLSRFEITFSTPQTLDVENPSIANTTTIDVYFSNEDKNIIIQNPHLKNIKTTEMFNMLGQSVLKIETNSNEPIITHKNKFMSAGTYIIKLKTDNGIVSKKVWIE
ncbi:GEVED domain-containing protein [Mariniflexile gromovii]|uniref:T9SS type A sorting domain-containing protein n=1 Tax=Mariniflexile gromovii TaxID=362523 RepID=A0ABS4BY66_9FLAO|nr:GEVED domain-containing protein [Mariniflexile gromovii]MBP0905537.1 T9SS type A sorting domain-containing protein [Mariniflexile gromovii]